MIKIPPEVVAAAVSAYNYASSDCYTTQEQDMRAAIAAALATLRAEVRSEALEEAAVVFDKYENDPFTAAVVADHLRRMKGDKNG